MEISNSLFPIRAQPVLHSLPEGVDIVKPPRSTLFTQIRVLTLSLSISCIEVAAHPVIKL
jgi:hypothetical protein